MSKLNVTFLNDDGRKWYRIDGECTDTGVEFENEDFAICENGDILDCDGCPLTEGDSQTIAVENAIKDHTTKNAPKTIDVAHCDIAESDNS